jgi:hypothetical protein
MKDLVLKEDLISLIFLFCVCFLHHEDGLTIGLYVLLQLRLRLLYNCTLYSLEVAAILLSVVSNNSTYHD